MPGHGRVQAMALGSPGLPEPRPRNHSARAEPFQPAGTAPRDPSDCIMTVQEPERSRLHEMGRQDVLGTGKVRYRPRDLEYP